MSSSFTAQDLKFQGTSQLHKLDPASSQLDDQHSLAEPTVARIKSVLNCVPPELIERFVNDITSVRPHNVAPSTDCTPIPQLIFEKSCLLDTLPPELRLQIFKLVFPHTWRGTVPELIKALRPIKGLYCEALAVFFKFPRVFNLSKGNNWSFGDMPDKMLSSLGFLTISLEDGRYDPRSPSYPSPDLFYLRKILPKCTKVRGVRIVLPWGIKGFWPLLPSDQIVKFLVGFERLITVVLHIPVSAMSQSFLGDIIDHTSRDLGQTPVLLKVFTFSPNPESIQFKNIPSGIPGQTCKFAYIRDNDRLHWVNHRSFVGWENWRWHKKFLNKVE